jgi:IS1 family transposase
MNDNKIYLDYVPERYRNIKLSPQWYFGPGKRQKRKHRKQHGKFGFMELSRMISERWAKLEESDPEVKKFVHKVAKQELEEYQREMKTYKELVERKTNAANKSNDMTKKRAHPGVYAMSPNQHTPLVSASPHQSLMNKSMQLRHKIDQLKYEIAQR